VLFHPEVPIIISGSEDENVFVWDANTYKQITQLQYGLKRPWSISATAESNYVALGFDEGTVVIKLGKDLPLATYMNGKVIYVKQREIQTFNLKLLQGASEESKDGEIVKPQNVKELGISEMSAQDVKFAPSGRYFAVLSETDFVIYTYPKYQNAAFGSATELVWSTYGSLDTHTYACRLENGTVKVYQNFAEYKAFKINFSNEGIFGGRLLAITGKDQIIFYDWEEFNVVRMIPVPSQVKQVVWSDNGSQVIIALEDTFYLLEFNAAEVTKIFAQGNLTEEQQEDGPEEAFTLIDEYAEVVTSGRWVSDDCFVWANNRGNINYLIGGRVMKLTNCGKKQFILGYDSKQSRLYLIDKSLNIHAYRLLMSVILF
jgi:coatomer subunit beta'